MVHLEYLATYFHHQVVFILVHFYAWSVQNVYILKRHQDVQVFVPCSWIEHLVVSLLILWQDKRWPLSIESSSVAAYLVIGLLEALVVSRAVGKVISTLVAELPGCGVVVEDRLGVQFFILTSKHLFGAVGLDLLV